MKLSRRGEYALKALLHVARAGAGAVTTAPVLARRERLPEPFLHQILLALAHGGVLRSRRGRGGGFVLNHPAEEICLGSVVRLMDGPLAPIPCASVTAYEPCPSCPEPERCELSALMRRVRDAVSDILDETTLAEMAASRVRRRPAPRRPRAKTRSKGVSR